MPPPDVPDLIDVELQGGPMDGSRLSLPAKATGHLTIGDGYSHFWSKTPFRTADGLIVFKYAGKVFKE
jgi:hypothetical protein